MSIEAIFAEMERIAPHIPSVLLTGGEPLAAARLPILIDELKKAGKWLAMESSGVGGKIPPGLDWLTISPKKKLPKEIMAWADELKFIVGPTPSAAQQQEINYWAANHPNVWLQPCADGSRPDPESNARCLQLVLASKGRLRLSTQVHKYLEIP